MAKTAKSAKSAITPNAANGDAQPNAGRWSRLLAVGARVWQRVSARPGVAHLIRAWNRSEDRMASQFAAAITYFSFLSLIPILMVAFSVAGLVLSSQPRLLGGLKAEITDLIPSGQLAEQIGGLIDQAIGQSLTVGIIGLVVALYSGLSWMGNVRDAVRAQWRPQWEKPSRPFKSVLMQYMWDLASLGGLMLALVVSFALTALGTAAQDVVVRFLGIGDEGFVHPVLLVGPFVLAIAASAIMFGWLYIMLPEKENRTDRRTLVIGSLAMAIVFEILKAALALLVTRMSLSPSGKVFGAIIGLLLFFNLVARAVLMIAAWMATADPQHVSPGTPS
ncbi:MAG: inner membrane protein YhjD [Nakamurella sp.]